VLVLHPPSSARTVFKLYAPPGAKIQYEAATITAILIIHQTLFIGWFLLSFMFG
jgi:hypothetical protein